MSLAALAAVFGVGVVAGLLSGLVGIGGGVLMVPFLYLFYAHAAFSGVRLTPELATLAAHATSLFVIVPTSLRGSWTFHRQKAVLWQAAWPIGLVAAVAAALATRVAPALDPRWLRLGFGVLLVYSAIRLVLTRASAAPGAPAVEPRPLRLSPPVTVGVGGAIGFFSSLLGVGGGVVGIPLLMGVVRVDLRRVAATSMAIIALTSLAAAAAYMLATPLVPVRGGWSLGYVDLPVALAMAAGTLVSVSWGARLNQRLNPRALARVFAALFALMGIRLIAGNLLG